MQSKKIDDKVIGIMQPYIFPYIGYWQLINAVDTFVLLDDVNFIKKGYINRNSILLKGQSYLFSIPVEKLSQNKLIKDTKLRFNNKAKEIFLKTIIMAYKKAPYFSYVYPILEDIILNDNNDLTGYIKYSIDKINSYLDINTEILISSEINKNNTLKGQDRIIEINKQLNASHYINPIGGQNLYDKKKFADNGIDLKFIKTKKITYKQFNNEFVPNLSIIDVLMFNSIEDLHNIINSYILI